MAATPRDLFSPVFEGVGGGEFELTMPDAPGSDPLLNMMAEAFGEDRVSVADHPHGASEDVRLVRDGEVVASSPLSAVMDTFLMVNSDLYRTGTSGVDEHEAPDVLTALDDVRFLMDGFPESTKQKLLLILVSRFIENRALTVGRGRLDAAFQRLSRIDDENGTRQVYSRLAASEVDLHVYGVGDANPLSDADVTRHTGRSERYRRTWFVVYTPPDERSDPDHGPVALVAVEVDRNTWRSVWTYRAELVERTRSIVASAF